MLYDQLSNDYKAAFKAKEELRVSVLRMLQAAIKNRELEKRNKLGKGETDPEKLERESRLNDEEIVATIMTEVKKRKDAMEQYRVGGREELAQKEAAESEILQAYLPEQMGEEAIRKLVKEAVVKSGAVSVREVGKVMGILMPQIKGKADGGLVNKIVQEELGG